MWVGFHSQLFAKPITHSCSDFIVVPMREDPVVGLIIVLDSGKQFPKHLYGVFAQERPHGFAVNFICSIKTIASAVVDDSDLVDEGNCIVLDSDGMKFGEELKG